MKAYQTIVRIEEILSFAVANLRAGDAQLGLDQAELALTEARNAIFTPAAPIDKSTRVDPTEYYDSDDAN